CRSISKSLDPSQKQSYVTIYPNQVVKLVNECFNPYKQDITTAMLDAMSILENGDIASSTGVLKDTKHNEFMAVLRGEAYYDEDGNFVYIIDEDVEEPTIPGDGEVGETGENPNGEIDPEDEGAIGNEDNTGDEDTTDSETGEHTDENTGDGSGDTDGGSEDEPVYDEPTIPDEPTEPDDGGEGNEY
ncbi:MAG: hypothetical protein IKM11_06805, partial [Oscillospiraceae bacterium]|nr:hypothetical protein [Oscillospiraceae bacterium]